MKTTNRLWLIGLALILAVGVSLPAGNVQAAIQNYAEWNDLGIVFTAPSGSAAYPSVLYSATGFGGGSPLYKMWYGDGGGQVYLTTSTNGETWGAPAAVSGLGNDADHVQVLYDAACFGVLPCNGAVPKYKMWYWDIDADMTTISALASAASVDGVTWANDTALTQASKAKLVSGTNNSWNKSTKGPISLIYQPRAKNRSKNPFSYKYILYYAATNGGNEVTALAYSGNGLDWTAYSTSSPVLNKGAAGTWDCDDAAFGTVYRDSAGYHYWYSGSGGTGPGGCAAGNPVQGIGLAASANGTGWTKTALPIFHVNQGVSYRALGVFAPSVIDEGNGVLRMYYTAADGTAGSPKKIGLAILTSGTVFVDDNWAGLPSGTNVTVSGTAHVISRDAFDTIQKGLKAVLSSGTVAVAAGTYTEQVTISRDVTLLGAGAGLSIINAPPGLPAANQPGSAIVLVSHGNAEMAGFTISGPGASACGSIAAGIYIYGNSFANIHNNTIQNIRDSSLSSCSNGIAIQVGSLVGGTRGTAAIVQNTIIGYQKGGILVDNAGSSAGISYNTITGAGTTGIALQTGIQISHGATATLDGNTVSGNSFHSAGSPNDWTGRGLLIAQAGMVTLSDDNVLSNNDRNLEKTGASGPLILGAETLGPSTAPGGSGYDLFNGDALPIDASGVTFAGAASGFAIEDLVQHQVDNASLGLVTWEPGNLYVTPLSGRIQRAINAANPGDTIHVEAGTYIEAITVGKALTLLGPNSTIDPSTGVRVAEAILRPAAIGTDPAGTCTILATISSSNVSLKGFSLDGNNPGLTSGVTVNGIDVDACKGIAGSAGVGNIAIEYNLVKNVTFAGVDFSNDTNPAATSNNTIRYNRLENMGNTAGIGVRINNDFYSDVTDNVFDDVRTGIQASNFSQANPGPTASLSRNQITSWRNGILFTGHSGSASAFTLQANSLTGLDSTLSDRWEGITLASLQNGVNVFVDGNDLTTADIHQTTVGYQVWNNPTTAALVIYGGAIHGADYGVWVNNYQTAGGNGASTSIKVDQVAIADAALAGIYADDDPANTNGAVVTATAVDSILSGSGAGVLVAGPQASATGSCNQISGNTMGVNNTTLTGINFENNWWGDASGPSGVGGGAGDAVSAQVDYTPWNASTTCGSTPPNNKPVANEQWVVTQKATPIIINLNGFDLEGSPLTYAVVTDPGHGTLVGSGAAWTYTPATNFSGSDSFTFKVNDGIEDSLPATVHITVTPANNAPVLAGPDPVSVSMSINGVPHPFSLTLNATDADADSLSWSIITAAGSGVASVSGTGASKDIFYAPDLNYSGPDSFVVQVADNKGGTDTVTVNVVVNTPPAITDPDPVILRISQNGTPVGFNLTLHASDVDGDALTWSLFAPAAHGTAIAGGSGVSIPVAYTPSLNYTGPDSFTVQVIDTYGGMDTIVVAVNVNSAPVIAEADPFSTTISQNGIPVGFSLTLHASDADDDTLTWSLAAPAGHGTAAAGGTGATQPVTYTPAPGYSGPDTFIVRVADPYGGVDNFSVNVTVNSVPVIGGADPVSIRISRNGTPTAFSLTLSASDANGGTLTWSIASPAAHGTASASGTGTSKAIAYTPAANYSGPDSFVVRVADAYGGADTVTINVLVNSPPSIGGTDPVLVRMSQNSAPLAFSLTLNAADADGDGLTWSISSQATHGTASASGTGASKAIAYTPTGAYTGPDSFVVRVADNYGGADTLTVNVIVNTSPVIEEGSPVSVRLSRNGSPTPFTLTVHAADLDGDTLTWSISTPAAHGTASVTGTGLAKAIGYVPALDYTGADTFVVQVADAYGGVGRLTVNVNVQLVLPPNHAPVIAETEPVSVRMSQNATPVGFILTLHASDQDNDLLTWSIATAAAHGVASASGTGLAKAITYTPVAGYSGTDTFVVRVADNYGGAATIRVNVTIQLVVPPNRAPVILETDPLSISMSRNGTPVPFTLSLHASDADGDTLTWSISTAAAHGTATASGIGSGKVISYVPNLNYIGPDTFVVRVSDAYGGSDTITIHVSVDSVTTYLYLPLISK